MNPMTQQEVVALMESSKSAQEWDDNCDLVKANGGYPDFWFPVIIMSGLARRVMAKFGETPDIKITKLP